MNVMKLPKLITTTELRSKMDDVSADLLATNTPYAITRGSDYLAVMVSPKFFEEALANYLEDFLDARTLEREIELTKDEPGIDFEAYVSKRLGKKYVQNYLKEKGSKVPRKN